MIYTLFFKGRSFMSTFFNLISISRFCFLKCGHSAKVRKSTLHVQLLQSCKSPVRTLSPPSILPWLVCFKCLCAPHWNTVPTNVLFTRHVCYDTDKQRDRSLITPPTPWDGLQSCKEEKKKKNSWMGLSVHKRAKLLLSLLAKDSDPRAGDYIEVS